MTMAWKASEFDRFLERDVDDLLDYVRKLGGRDRTTAFRHALSRLEQDDEGRRRIMILRFLQALLAQMTNGRLAASAAEPAAFDLSRIATSSDEPVEAKRAALDALALLFLKAKELTPLADSRIRAAFETAGQARDPELRSFARTALAPNGVLARRMISRHHRWILVSAIVPSPGESSIAVRSRTAAATTGRSGRQSDRSLQ